MRVDLARGEVIEQLRCQMISIAEELGSLTHPDVIRISQQLDVLINEVQMLQSRRFRSCRFVLRSLWKSPYTHRTRAVRISHQYT